MAFVYLKKRMTQLGIETTRLVVIQVSAFRTKPLLRTFKKLTFKNVK